jgi:hypothetical protein
MGFFLLAGLFAFSVHAAAAPSCPGYYARLGAPEPTADAKLGLWKDILAWIAQPRSRGKDQPVNAILQQRWGPVNAKGLRLDGKRLHGSPRGGIVARVVDAAESKYGIKFVVESGQEHGTGSALGKEIHLASDFLAAPDMGVLLHEIRHVSTNKREIAARTIKAYFPDNGYQPADLWGSYKSRFRFDEVEARLGQSLVKDAAYREKKEGEARRFLQEEKRILQAALVSLRKNPPTKIVRVQSDYSGKTKRMISLPVDMGQAGKSPGPAGRGRHQGIELRIPYDGPGSPEARNSYIRKILQKRLRQLEVLERGRLKAPEP